MLRLLTKNIQHCMQKWTSRRANFELSISFLLISRGTLGRCSRNLWVTWNPGWKSLAYTVSHKAR